MVVCKLRPKVTPYNIKLQIVSFHESADLFLVAAIAIDGIVINLEKGGECHVGNTSVLFEDNLYQ